MNRTPFTIQDAQVALWTTDSTGALATQLYLGGWVETFQSEESFKARTLFYPGLPTGSVFHEDEEHAVELKNVWLHSRAGGTPRMPAPYGRNVSMVLVVVWLDEDSGAWCNRTYTGVKGKGRTLEAGNTYQVVRYTAETMDETAGLGAPVFTPMTYGDIRHVDGGQSEILYRYGLADGSIQAIDPSRLAATASLVVGTSGGGSQAHGGQAQGADVGLTATVAFGDGAPVLVGTLDGVTVSRIVALGNTLADQEPRVEFWNRSARVATLGSDGTLAVIDVRESATRPAGGIAILQGDTWLFTLDAVCTAPSFNETLAA